MTLGLSEYFKSIHKSHHQSGNPSKENFTYMNRKLFLDRSEIKINYVCRKLLKKSVAKIRM